jgi:hypothetical protein
MLFPNNHIDCTVLYCTVLNRKSTEGWLACPQRKYDNKSRHLSCSPLKAETKQKGTLKARNPGADEVSKGVAACTAVRIGINNLALLLVSQFNLLHATHECTWLTASHCCWG